MQYFGFFSWASSGPVVQQGTTFDQQQTPSYGSQALDLAGDMQTFFTRPIEVESQGDPATLSYTSLKHFNVMTNRQELIKRDQIE